RARAACRRRRSPVISWAYGSSATSPRGFVSLAAAARGMKMMTDDPALALAQHVCRTSYADLPASAVESAPATSSTHLAACSAAAVRPRSARICGLMPLLREISPDAAALLREIDELRDFLATNPRAE